MIDVVLSPDKASQEPNPTLATAKPVLAAETGNVNISQAPFTTFQPNFVPTETPTDAATPTLDNGLRSSSYQTASSTSTKKSDTKKSDASLVHGASYFGPVVTVWFVIAVTSAFWTIGIS